MFVYLRKRRFLVLLGLLLVGLPEVEVELGTLKEVSVGTANLSRAGCNTGKDTSSLHLVLNVLLQLAVANAGDPTALAGVGRLKLLVGGTLLSEEHTVVLVVPLTEGGGVDRHDGSLHEGLGTDHLVAGCVVHNIDDARLAGARLGSPREVSVVKTEGTELQVSSPGAHGADTVVSVCELGVGGHTSELVLPLLLVDLTLSSGDTALVQSATSDSHFAGFW